MEDWWNDTDIGKPEFSGKTCPSAIFQPQSLNELTYNPNPSFTHKRL
jgi:hypothetical protein